MVNKLEEITKRAKKDPIEEFRLFMKKESGEPIKSFRLIYLKPKVNKSGIIAKNIHGDPVPLQSENVEIQEVETEKGTNYNVYYTQYWNRTTGYFIGKNKDIPAILSEPRIVNNKSFKTKKEALDFAYGQLGVKTDRTLNINETENLIGKLVERQFSFSLGVENLAFDSEKIFSTEDNVIFQSDPETLRKKKMAKNPVKQEKINPQEFSKEKYNRLVKFMNGEIEKCLKPIRDEIKEIEQKLLEIAEKEGRTTYGSIMGLINSPSKSMEELVKRWKELGKLASKCDNRESQFELIRQFEELEKKKQKKTISQRFFRQDLIDKSLCQKGTYKRKMTKEDGVQIMQCKLKTCVGEKGSAGCELVNQAKLFDKNIFKKENNKIIRKM